MVLEPNKAGVDPQDNIQEHIQNGFYLGDQKQKRVGEKGSGTNHAGIIIRPVIVIYICISLNMEKENVKAILDGQSWTIIGVNVYVRGGLQR